MRQLVVSEKDARMVGLDPAKPAAGVARAAFLVVWMGAWLAPTLGVAQDRSAAQWTVRVLDATSGAPLSGAVVTFPESGGTRVTDSLGVAEAVSVGIGVAVRVVVDRLGYDVVDTVLVVSADRGTADLLLERAPVGLPALTVAVDRSAKSRELARVMFSREVAVGAVGMTSSQVKAVPAVVEADVFRSLRSLAGVTGVDDYNAGMYVRGGDSDQVGVRWEGAPVFAPYHLFGMFGVFNSDVVETVELYKGSIPARYGGSLSGVLSARQRTGGASGVRANGGLSLLGVRAAVDGSLPWGGARWLAAGRRATVDVAGVGGPYSFYDLNLGLQLYPGEEHRVGFSMLGSEDEFSWDFGGVGDWLDSRWTNLVSSLAWTWIRGNRVSSEVVAYASRYEGSLATGAGSPPPVARNVISASGLSAGITLRGERTGARAGVVFEGGPVSLHGSGPGAYLEGDASGSYSHLSVFAEIEQWFGPLRLAPGFRASVERSASRRFFEPRLAARLHAGPLALSASVDRTHQFLSVLHDDRYPVPGAPMWFVRERGQPVSVADGASVALDAWKGERWTGSVGGWARRFRGIPFWRPEASRVVSEMAFHDGEARGWEAMVQRHAGRVLGWISYQWARVRLADGEGAGYLPVWDRRHEVDGVVTVPGWRGWSSSLRCTVATGTPFWVPLGSYPGLRYDPNTIGSNRLGGASRNDALRGLGPNGNRFTILSNVQGRVPYYTRVDLSVRYEFGWGSWKIAPFLSVANITGRDNPHSYFPRSYTSSPGALPGGPYEQRVDMLAKRQIPTVPFIGVDFRF